MEFKTLNLELIEVAKMHEVYEVSNFIGAAVNVNLFRSVKSWGGNIIDVDPDKKSGPSVIQYVTLTIEAPLGMLTEFYNKLELLIQSEEYLRE